MGKYRIHPAGVQHVLSATAADGADFATILKPLTHSVESAGAGTGGSGAIVPALESFFTVQSTRMTGISDRVGACLTGAAEATKAYLKGDEEMAATYQANAVKVANSGTFTPHGR